MRWLHRVKLIHLHRSLSGNLLWTPQSQLHAAFAVKSTTLTVALIKPRRNNQQYNRRLTRLTGNYRRFYVAPACTEHVTPFSTVPRGSRHLRATQELSNRFHFGYKALTSTHCSHAQFDGGIKAPAIQLPAERAASLIRGTSPVEAVIGIHWIRPRTHSKGQLGTGVAIVGSAVK